MSRDWIEAHRSTGGQGRRIPLVRLEDLSYEDEDHVVLMDDAERKLLAEGISRVRRNDWQASAASANEKTVLFIGAVIVALTSVTGSVISVLAAIGVIH